MLQTIPTVLYLNGYDTRRLGLVVEDYANVLDSAPSRVATAVVLGRAGSVALDRLADTSTRSLTITGTLLAATAAEARTNLDALRGRLARGELELRFADRPDRVWYARRRKQDATPIGPIAVSAACRVTIELDLLDAYHYTVEPTLVRITNTARTPCPLGTAPSAPVLELMGPGTDPVVTYRRADGTAMGSMAFTAILASTDVLRCDADTQVITRSTNGVLTTANDILTGGRFFALDPADGAGTGPTLEVSQVTQGVCTYRKAWT